MVGNIIEPMVETNLCLLKKENEVLLAMKKRGFGVGKWNGVGGKVKPGESHIEAAVREIKEEIGVDVAKEDLVEMGKMKFVFQDNDDWGTNMTIYVVTKWLGRPTESEEMAPKWFNVNEIPYDDMWEDDRLWIPMILDGKRIEGDFLFDENQKIIGYEIRESRN